MVNALIADTSARASPCHYPPCWRPAKAAPLCHRARRLYAAAGASEAVWSRSPVLNQLGAVTEPLARQLITPDRHVMESPPIISETQVTCAEWITAKRVHSRPRMVTAGWCVGVKFHYDTRSTR